MLSSYRSVLIAVIILLLAAGCRSTDEGGSNAAPAGTGRAAINAVLPAFQVKTLDDQTASLDKYRGKIVILDLFASWCPPCRMEIPQFVHLQTKYADRLAVVGLAYDQGSVDPLKRFLEQMKINYDVYWGTEEIANYVGLRGIPHTLVLDREGRITYTYIGFTPEKTFEENIQALSAPAAGTKQP
jgi:thiol-disulfide isomerase/thioredoxin